MTTADFLVEIGKVVSDDPMAVRLDTKLYDIPGWDSLALVVLLGMIDQKLDVQLDPAKIDETSTVQELVNMLPGKIE